MLRKTSIGVFVLLLFTTVLVSAASAKSIDCTGKSGTLNCPKVLSRVPSGPEAGKFRIVGSGGDDVIRGSKAGIGDRIIGGDGNDRLIGERGNDVLEGGRGNDRLDGSGDNDILRGGPGNDSLGADSGRDRLEGGPGNDGYGIPQGSHQIFDTSGNDFLRLPRAKVRTTTFETIGTDLVIRFNTGEVRINNHLGAGRIETVTLSDGSVRFDDTSLTVASDSFKTAADDGTDVSIGIDPKFNAEITVDPDTGEITAKGEAGFSLQIDIDLGDIINDIIEAFSPPPPANQGNNGGGNGGDGSDQRGQDFDSDEGENDARAGAQADAQAEENDRQ